MLGSLYVPMQRPVPARQEIVQSYANGLTVRAPRYAADPEHRTAEFSGGVVATYGPTVVTADRILFHTDADDPYAEALGHVKLVDPEGTLTAGDLTFHWKTRVGVGHSIVAQVSTLKLSADSIDIKPGIWILRNVGGTGCSLRTPLYYLHSRELQVKPGETIRAIRPELSILGHRILTLPSRTLSLTESSGSIDVPYPTYRSERGFGLNWSPEIPIDSETSLYARYAAYQRSLPYYGLTAMHSLLPDRSPEIPSSEIGDRFTFGYFDSVQVREPASEKQYLAKRRLDVGLSSTFGADGRDTTTESSKINKPIEFLAQASGEFGGFGAFGLVRGQQIRIGDGPKLERVVFEGNLRPPALRLGGGLAAYSRLDLAEYAGGKSYGWTRGQIGVGFDAGRYVRLGASYSAAQVRGTPDFAYDAPYKIREIAFRADFDFDTTQLRLLVKMDPAGGGIFDREIYFSQAVGCLEPYLVYRERPHKFFLGIKLPISRAIDRLSRDLEERRAAIRHVVSGPP